MTISIGERVAKGSRSTKRRQTPRDGLLMRKPAGLFNRRHPERTYVRPCVRSRLISSWMLAQHSRSNREQTPSTHSINSLKRITVASSGRASHARSTPANYGPHSGMMALPRQRKFIRKCLRCTVDPFDRSQSSRPRRYNFGEFHLRGRYGRGKRVPRAWLSWTNVEIVSGTSTQWDIIRFSTYI